MTEPFDPFDPELLWGKSETFSEAERKRREAYVNHVHIGSLEPPHREWLVPCCDGVSGDAGSRLATAVFNILTDSHPYFRAHGGPTGGLPDILEDGQDAELWTLIRIALAEAPNEDFTAILEERAARPERPWPRYVDFKRAADRKP